MLCLAFGYVDTPPWLLIATLLLIGIWMGDALAVRFVRITLHTAIAPTRWILAGGTIVMIALMAWSPVFPFANWVWVFLPMLGFALGLIRPLSWLWELPLGLALLLGSRFGLSVDRLRALHPVTLDELCLLPLPGLRALLVYACEREQSTGASWLLDVAAHPGQHGAALGAVRAIIRRGTVAHPLLLWLSTHPTGQDWLHTLQATTGRLPPLLRGYSALMSVDDAGVWPTVIAQHRHAFVQAQHAPDGHTMLLLLDTVHDVLQAPRWSVAVDALQRLPDNADQPTDELQQALWLLRLLACEDELPPTEQATLQDAVQRWDVIGWPGAMLDTVLEHLSFLLAIEQQREIFQP
jgi:hypothetical protein